MKDKSKGLTLGNFYFDYQSNNCVIQSAWMRQLWSEFADKDRLKKETEWELKGKKLQDIEWVSKEHEYGFKSEYEDFLSFPEHRTYFDDPLKEEAFCFFIVETGIDNSEEKYEAPFWGEKYSENKNSFLVHSRYFHSLSLCYKHFFEIQRAVEEEFGVGPEECFLDLERINNDLWYTMGDLLAYWHIDDRRKRFSKKGGQGHGKIPAVFEAVKYALAKSKFKTVRGLWDCLKREFDKNEPFVTKDSDVFFEENVMMIRTFRKRGKTKEHMTDQTIKFSTFKTYISAYKKNG